jgi:hypothetical protein
MRSVLFVNDSGKYKAGQNISADDQVACDAIAQGDAVPSIYAEDISTTDTVDEPAPERVTLSSKNLTAAPENK